MRYEITHDTLNKSRFAILDSSGLVIERNIATREQAEKSMLSWGRLMAKEQRRPKMTHAEYLRSLRANFDNHDED